MKKFSLCLLVAVLVMMSVLSSCNAKNEGVSYGRSTYDEAIGGNADNESNFDSIREVTENNGAAAPSDFTKKLIKTASVVLEVKVVNEAYNAISEYVKANGGYEFSHSQRKNGEDTVVEVTFKIPPDNMEKLIKFSAEKGELISSDSNAQDITDSYYDSKLRLDSLKSQLEKYKKFLEDTKTTDEMLKVQSEIDRLILEIESLEGRLSKWDKEVAESTVSFIITQKADPSLKRREINWSALSFSDMGYLIKSGFLGVINVIVIMVQWVAIILLVTSPIWIVAGIILFVMLKKRKAKDKMMKEEKQGGEIDLN